jgi:Phage tail protein
VFRYLCEAPNILTLTLGALTLDLMDADNGFAVSQVDLGYPTVREDVTPISNRHGQWDNTAWFGPRVISVSGSIMPAPFGSRSKVLDRLAPFLDPSARPTLTYQIDPDVAPRMIGLRAAALSAPATHPSISSFQASWVASDPRAYTTDVDSVTLLPSGVAFGRRYVTPQTGTVTNTSGWTHPRVYPDMRGSTQVAAVNDGTLPALPTVTVWGPCTNPKVWNDTAGAVLAIGTTAAPYALVAGSQVTFDVAGRQVYAAGDPEAGRYQYVDFTISTWWSLAPGPNNLRYSADTATSASTAVVAWSDAYLL